MTRMKIFNWLLSNVSFLAVVSMILPTPFVVETHSLHFNHDPCSVEDA